MNIRKREGRKEKKVEVMEMLNVEEMAVEVMVLLVVNMEMGVVLIENGGCSMHETRTGSGGRCRR